MIRYTVDFSGAPGSIDVNLGSGLVLEDGFNSVDTIIDVENVIGSDDDDVIAGNDEANTLEAGDGTD